MNSITVLLFSLQICLGLDTNYQHYTAGGIKSALTADSSQFKLNGKDITLFSGSLHYWRCPWQYWSDRLLKFRAGGLNTVQTYVDWGIHEEIKGHLDFENGFLNLGDFLKKAKEQDLFVILRIGPFIAAETEFGGYPAWISNDSNMRLRSSYKGHLDAFEPYYKKVLSIANEHQFTKGGSVIAIQYENEFGDPSSKDAQDYFKYMHDMIVQSGFQGLLTNCGNGHSGAQAVKHTISKVLVTLNWANPKEIGGLIDELKKAQPNKPIFVSEFWSGWMDNWGGSKHNTGLNVNDFASAMDVILFKEGGSINFYMYYGGTNFWYTNGGRVTTSYDYNAPLSESGDYTPKYYKAKELFAKLVKERKLPELHIPNPPAHVPAANYGTIKVKDYLSLDDIVSHLQPKHDTRPGRMEEYGQAYGFLLYRITTNKFKNLQMRGGVRDRAVVLIDNNRVGVCDNEKDYNISLNDNQFSKANDHKLDIILENTGRDWDIHKARKGLNGALFLDNKEIKSFQIYPLPLKEDFVSKLNTAKGSGLENNKPGLYRAELEVKGNPSDTFLKFDGWVKGNAFINGFNIGRYWNTGPQHTLYVPGPYLKSGKNDIFMFELESHSNEIHFVDKPDLGKQ